MIEILRFPETRALVLKMMQEGREIADADPLLLTVLAFLAPFVVDARVSGAPKLTLSEVRQLW